MTMNNTRFKREVTEFTSRVRDEISIETLENIKNNLKIKTWLDFVDKDRKSILHLKINIVKARINEILNRWLHM